MSFLDNVRDWFKNIINHDDHVEVTVVRGDTLWSICEKASGARTNAEIQGHVEDVAKLNPDMDPDRIHPGQVIKLPRSWG